MQLTSEIRNVFIKKRYIEVGFASGLSNNFKAELSTFKFQNASTIRFTTD